MTPVPACTGGRYCSPEAAQTARCTAWGQVDIAVVEAGLGGARDATNVFPAPDRDPDPARPRSGLRLAVITAIGLEHQARPASVQRYCWFLQRVQTGLPVQPHMLTCRAQTQAPRPASSCCRAGAVLPDFPADMLYVHMLQ
jgi:hypothetical protein